MSNIQFDSAKNYLKQYLQDSIAIDKPATADPNWDVYYSTVTLTHDLGYKPLVRAWYDYENNGTYFPMHGQAGDAYSALYFFHTPVTCFIYEITDTTVTFRTEIATVDGGPLSGSFPIYYKVYLDPTEAV